MEKVFKEAIMDKNVRVDIQEENTVPEEPKKKKTKSPKARAIEELINTPVNKMTEKEKEVYIKHLEEENTLLTNKNQELNINISSFTQQLRRKEQEFETMENHYRTTLQYVQDATSVHARNITALLYGGIN